MYATRSWLVEAASRRRPTHVRDLQMGAISTMAEDSSPVVVVEYQQNVRSASGDSCRNSTRGIPRCSKRPSTSSIQLKSFNGIIFTACQQSAASPFVRHYASREAQRAKETSTPVPASSNQGWSAEDHGKALRDVIGEKEKLNKRLDKLKMDMQSAEDVIRELKANDQKMELLNLELQAVKKELSSAEKILRDYDQTRNAQFAVYDQRIASIGEECTSLWQKAETLAAEQSRSQELIAEHVRAIRRLESTRDTLTAQLSEAQDRATENTSIISSLKATVGALQSQRNDVLHRYETLKIDTSSAFETNEGARRVFRKEVEGALEIRLSGVFSAEKAQLRESIKLLQTSLTNERDHRSRLQQRLEAQEQQIRILQHSLTQANNLAELERDRFNRQTGSLSAQIRRLEYEAQSREKRAQQRDTYQKYHEIWDEFKRAATMIGYSNAHIKDTSEYWSSASESFQTQDTLSRFRHRHADLNSAITEYLTTRLNQAKAAAATVKDFRDELWRVQDELSPVGHRSRALTKVLHHDEPHLYDLMRRNLDLLIETPLQRLQEELKNGKGIPNGMRNHGINILGRFRSLYVSMRELFLLQVLQQASDQDKAVYLVANQGADVLAQRVDQQMSKERWKLMRADQNVRAMTSNRFILEQQSGILDADRTQKLGSDIESLIHTGLLEAVRGLERRNADTGTVAPRRSRPGERVLRSNAGPRAKRSQEPQAHSSAPNTTITIRKYARPPLQHLLAAKQAIAPQPSQSEPTVRLPGTVADAAPKAEMTDGNAAVQENTGTRLGAMPRFRQRTFPARRRMAPIARGFSTHAGLSAAIPLLADPAPSDFGNEAAGRTNWSPSVRPIGPDNGAVTAAASASQTPRSPTQPCLVLESKMNSPAEIDSDQLLNNASSAIVTEDGESEADAASVEVESTFELTYQIPASTFSQAEASSGPASPLFWTHKLYKNPKGQSPVVFYCTSYETCERQAKLFLDEPVVGFDLEWEIFASVKKHGPKQNVSLIQIASESQIGLFHVACFKGDSTEELMPPSLRALLESASITKAGVNIVGDANRMRTFFDVEMKGLMELSHIYRLVKYAEQESHLVNFKLCGLAMQVQDILTLPLKKDETRTSRWSSKLNAQQTEYAAADAYAGFHLYHALEGLRLLMDPRPPRPAFYETFSPLVLPDGTKVFRSEKRAASSVKKIPQAVVAVDEASEGEEFFDALEMGNADEADGSSSSSVDASDTSVSDSSEIVYPTLPIEHLAKPCEEGGDAQDAKVLPLRLKAGVALPANPETLAADSWAQTFLATGSSSSRKKSSSARPQKSVNASTLRAYHLWHEQNFDIGRVARFCREPPLALTTVATYVMTAIKEESLPFDVERAREVLKALPSSIKYRYASFIEAKGAA